MDDKKIQKILDDLYAIDDNLKDHEDELRKAVRLLLEAKKEIIPDEEFKTRLLESIKTKEPETSLIGNMAGRLSIMSRISYVAAGALVVVAALLINNLGGADVVDFGKISVNSIQERAFGSLSDSSQLSASAPAGKGGGGSESASPAIAMGLGGGGGDMSAGVMPPYVAKKYVFKYEGDDISLEDSKVDVLKRTANTSSRNQLASIIKKLNFDVLKTSSFGNLYVQNISLAEDKDYGYVITINMDEGFISIYQNWAKWRNAYPNCQDQACWERNRITQKDIPSDEALISTANSFLTEHNISLSGYGDPEVNREQLVYYVKMAEQNSSEIWLPDTISVIYPSLIDGKKVYDGSMPYGINVSINVRVNKVSSVGGLSVQTYQSSSYDAEQDFNKILSVARNGGVVQYYEEPNAQEIEIGIGTPERGYMQVWRNDPNTGEGYQLIVPALIFPVTDIPANENIWQNYITVPLVKEMLETPNNSGPVRIMEGQSETVSE